jgi:hypothetical protein
MPTPSLLLSDFGTVSQSERRLYILRDQLKVQFLATQRAQINERKAADSKRRLTSYVPFTEKDCVPGLIRVADMSFMISLTFRSLNRSCVDGTDGV